jgi:hypothetical protein
MLAHLPVIILSTRRLSSCGVVGYNSTFIGYKFLFNLNIGKGAENRNKRFVSKVITGKGERLATGAASPGRYYWPAIFMSGSSTEPH